MLRFVLLAGLLAFCLPSAAAAQGLLWKLPAEDGTSVTYAGTYSQVIRRANSTEQDVELSFNRELRVRSVGQQQVDWNGQSQTGRWIEFEQTTQSGGGVQDVGPGGTMIVKLLVPESFIDGQLKDNNGIPKTAIPYTRGYLQRDGGAIEDLPGGVYQPFPSVTLLRMPKTLEQTGGGWTATESLEGPTSRIEVQTQLTRDDGTPFGLQSWTVTTKESEKQAAEPRDAYTLRSESTESMELKRTESGAVSAIDRD